MTEREKAAVSRSQDLLTIGPSAMHWDRGRLTIRISEIATPLLGALRGTVVIDPLALAHTEFSLDAQGQHRWRPVAPCARASVVFEQPAWRWQGNAYIDSNRGARPLEHDFRSWHWSRAHLNGRRTAVLYDVRLADTSEHSVALRFDAHGNHEDFTAPPKVALRASHWGVPRTTHGDEAGRTTITRTLEDTPFYARSLLETRLLGENVHAFHESLSLERFAKPWVQAMLPFRMPRRSGA